MRAIRSPPCRKSPLWLDDGALPVGGFGKNSPNSQHTAFLEAKEVIIKILFICQPAVSYVTKRARKYVGLLLLQFFCRGSVPDPVEGGGELTSLHTSAGVIRTGRRGKKKWRKGKEAGIRLPHTPRLSIPGPSILRPELRNTTWHQHV